MNNNRNLVTALSSLLLVLVGCSDVSESPQVIQQSVASTPGTFDRTVLPVPDPVFPKITELDARNATAPPPFSVTPPDGAPNVVIVLIDDIGFGASDGFGGAIQTPTLDRLANDGLRFNQFHTTALCSPTRMAILTGRNHHSANAGSVMEVATGRNTACGTPPSGRRSRDGSRDCAPAGPADRAARRRHVTAPSTFRRNA